MTDDERLDSLAAMAMQAILSFHGIADDERWRGEADFSYYDEEVAGAAYTYAEAMMEQRAKRMKETKTVLRRGAELDRAVEVQLVKLPPIAE